MSAMFMDLPLDLLKWELVANMLFLFLSLYSVVLIVSAVRNPLRKVPGPFYSNFTRLVLKWAIITGSRLHYIDALHKKYGPHVRISPSEVAVADPISFKAIHKIGSGFLKPDWYQTLVNMPYDSVFTMTDPKLHGARRKLFSRAFSKSYLLQNWEPMVHERVKLAVGRIRADAVSMTADLLKWWILMATDVTVHLSFGNSFQMVEKGQVSDYILAVQSGIVGNGITSEMLWLREICRRLPGKTAARFFRSYVEIGNKAQEAINGSRKEGVRENIFSSIKIDANFTKDNATAEAIILIVAGSDSTAVSLTYLVWSVLSHPEIQHELESEVATLPAGFGVADTENLPVLNAVIQETMRLYGAANGGIPRVVPAGGVQMGGYYLPEGTMATTQAYSIHRDATLFPEPLSFNPSRWADMSPEAKAAYHPFGAGARTCLGIHVAQMEMRLAVAEFFRECAGARLAPSATSECMAIKQFFLLNPAGHKCEITLKA